MATVKLTATLDSGESVEMSFADISPVELRKMMEYASKVFTKTKTGIDTRSENPVDPQAIRNYRLSTGSTQTEFGKVLGVSTAQVSMMESGKRFPSKIVDKKLRELLEK